MAGECYPAMSITEKTPRLSRRRERNWLRALRHREAMEAESRRHQRSRSPRTSGSSDDRPHAKVTVPVQRANEREEAQRKRRSLVADTPTVAAVFRSPRRLPCSAAASPRGARIAPRDPALNSSSRFSSMLSFEACWQQVISVDNSIIGSSAAVTTPGVQGESGAVAAPSEKDEDNFEKFLASTSEWNRALYKSQLYALRQAVRTEQRFGLNLWQDFAIREPERDTSLPVPMAGDSPSSPDKSQQMPDPRWRVRSWRDPKALRFQDGDRVEETAKDTEELRAAYRLRQQSEPPQEITIEVTFPGNKI